MIAGKPVPNAGSDVRTAGHHAPGVPDEERPGWQPSLLGLCGPTDDVRHPSGRAQSVRPRYAHTAHWWTTGHGFPGADYEPAGLATSEGPLAVRLLGPNGAGPHDARAGQRREPRKVHDHVAHAAVVHCDSAQRPAVRSHNHVERGRSVNPPPWGLHRDRRTRWRHHNYYYSYLIVNITVVE